ncbi:ATP-binding protein [Burkholderia sp. Leaf177]|uniref:ATP-grasp domain-containing protein n=1 Tax=Burkholderia sp. Leaf177 TaxID=1736287 RepID=UPI0006FD944D|nr:ATP-grasp domain-containing protein [Burkholderia sp. Leaf177]KQR76770.1 ATP-binding protein [Burkholderia sp. Leaf177]
MSARSTHAPFIAAVGLSARMLAQSAHRAGFNVAALDIFGDRDTRCLAPLWFDISGGGLSIDRQRLFDALERTARLPRMLGFVVGSGLEPMMPELCSASRLPRFIGNGAAPTAAVREPRRFFALLDRLGIAHPEVAFTPPANNTGWLVKHANGCGGTHIEVLSQSDPSTVGDAYFQRRAPGRSMSALFIAARGKARVIGFAEQLSMATGHWPYLHAGSIGPIDLPRELKNKITESIEVIAAETRLVGLNSIDFLLDGERFEVLEINARPSSTMTLYESASPDAWPRGLLACHVDACIDGRLPSAASPVTKKSGQRVLFAPYAFTVSQAFSQACFTDPACHDVPHPGTRIGVGEPVCTLVVTQTSESAVRDELDRRETLLLQRIETCSEDADVVTPFSV